ncbi:uncharacterized protein LOC123507531 [Portunus trituberculatus]|uniref:uncharacterized protein LOC123507531 n=1 Tax=Portunus trituberculatus TaxID=210409 RepID=UPI001E1D05A9|nr:uncharacterized protein LOC123507531 [Portunus trituberculatus]
MLPPDVSWTPVSWRVMVFLMQLCGCFPFKISATDDPPMFSVYLFLWSVFVIFITTSIHFSGYREVFFTQVSSSVGTTIFVYTVLALMAGMTLSNVIMAMKSNNLANFLHDLSRFKGASPSPARRWYSKPKTLVFTITLMIAGIMMTWTTLQSMQATSPCLAVIALPTSLIGLVNFVLPMELPSMIFGLLVGHLVVATETAVARVSFLLDSDTDGSFKCEDKMKAANEALGDLEAIIREVEVKRERAARHFFPSISMFLLSGLMLGITSPYVMNVGSIHKSISLSSLLLGYYIMGRLCHMGQVFVNKVGRARQLLRPGYGTQSSLFTCIDSSTCMFVSVWMDG